MLQVKWDRLGVDRALWVNGDTVGYARYLGPLGWAGSTVYGDTYSYGHTAEEVRDWLLGIGRWRRGKYRPFRCESCGVRWWSPCVMFTCPNPDCRGECRADRAICRACQTRREGR